MQAQTDGLVRFDCPSGHRLKANPRHAGRTVKCPACGGCATIPPADPSLTPSQIINFLDETQSASQVLRSRESSLSLSNEPLETKAVCPRCHELIEASAHLCHHCKLYFGSGQHSLSGRLLRLFRRS